MWEAAQFCVLSRLRTPLGKPQDTFAAIESAVKQCSAAVQRHRHDTTTVAPSKPAGASLQGITPSETNIVNLHLQLSAVQQVSGTFFLMLSLHALLSSAVLFRTS